MTAYAAISGTNRTVKDIYCQVSGTNRMCTSGYCAISSTNRQFFSRQIATNEISAVRLVPYQIQYGNSDSSGNTTSYNYLSIHSSSNLNNLSSEYGRVTISGTTLTSYGSSSYTLRYNRLDANLYIYTTWGSMYELYNAYSNGLISSCTIYSQAYMPTVTSAAGTCNYWCYSYTSSYNSLPHTGTTYSFSNVPQSSWCQAGITVNTTSGRGSSIQNNIYRVTINGTNFTPVVYYQ